MTDEHINALHCEFPQLSGRDIKQLLRLTRRYDEAKGNTKFDIESFRVCAMFRGLK